MQQIIKTSSEAHLKNGLVLSGGGGRGLAHLGVLKSFEENDIRIDKISGVSMGAVIGAFWAAGYTADEIKHLFETITWKKWLRPAFGQYGILSLKNIKSLLSDYLPNNFKDLKTPFIISTFCLQEAQLWRIEEGNLIEAIAASIAVPIIFPPVEIQNKDFVDSGLIENLPVKPLLTDKKEYFIIGVHSNPISSKFKVSSLKTLAERYFHALGVISVRKEAPKCDWYIEPPDINHLKFTNTNIEKAYQMGYVYTNNFLKEQTMQSQEK